jgi:hypothetical protein
MMTLGFRKARSVPLLTKIRYSRKGDPDLTLKFGDESWQIHKAIACHLSRWFLKATTGGFEASDRGSWLIVEALTDFKKESHSGVVTLKDDPEFLPAIHCMVSYFYNNDYDASEHDVHEPLLHAQVTVIADKYDCASLFKYARDSLAESMSVVVCHEWVDVAALIQEYATTDGSAHLKLRNTLLYAVPRDPVRALKFLHDEHVSGFLR